MVKTELGGAFILLLFIFRTSLLTIDGVDALTIDGVDAITVHDFSSSE